MTSAIAAVGSHTLRLGKAEAVVVGPVREPPAARTRSRWAMVLLAAAIRLHRWVLVGTMLAGGVLADDAGAAELVFPYRARVVVDRAVVRSGPGEDYYPVMHLSQDAVVEVYRHDPGGWYAVRPPEGSYSWVSAAFVEPQRDGSLVAAIRGRRVVVRVGSPLVDVPDVIQLRLNSGDQVRLLDRQPFEFSNMVWYKIAPPAGEFRWVFGRDVEALDEAGAAITSGEQALPTGQRPARRASTNEKVTAGVPDADSALDADATAGVAEASEEAEDELLAWLARRRERRRKVLAAIESGKRLPAEDAEPPDLAVEEPPLGTTSVPDVARALLEEDPDALPADLSATLAAVNRQRALTADYQEPSSRAEDRNGRLAAFDASLEAWLEEEQALARRRLSGSRLQREGEQATDLAAALEELDLALCAMASEPAETWDLEPLRERAEHILASAETALDRGRARLMLRKLARFEDVQQRYLALNPKARRRTREPRQLDLAEPEAQPARVASRTRYDGEGTLTRVVTRTPGAPPYALLDATGEVKYYVSPAPGVNLRRYEGLRVAVVGSVGYLPEHKAKHVTVKQVLPLAAEGLELSAYRQP